MRGNVDTDAWAADLPLTANLTVEARILYVIHDRCSYRSTRRRPTRRVVVFGHSHQALIDRKDRVLSLIRAARDGVASGCP